MKTKMYKCGGCNMLIPHYEIQTAGDPFGDGTVEVCPQCNEAEMLTFSFEVDWDAEAREEARLDALFDARYSED